MLESPIKKGSGRKHNKILSGAPIQYDDIDSNVPNI